MRIDLEVFFDMTEWKSIQLKIERIVLIISDSSFNPSKILDFSENNRDL